VLVGPRQVGKTTAAAQLAARLGWPSHTASADAPLPHPPEWIETQWRLARAAGRGRVLLVLDEIQKVRGWSEVVKRLWDEELRTGARVRPLLLGSSALLVQKGLTESLAGRFFVHRCTHWSWSECRAAFGWPLERWLYFGGYPGAAAFAGDEPAWKRYVTDSLIETVIARDVLQMQTVAKPALLRHLFALAAAYPVQTLSYTKMLGQLQDAGNTVTLAGYLRLLETAFLASGLELHTRGQVRRRGSSPKLILWNNALVNAPSLLGFRQAQADGAWWGRLVENAVGAHLLNGLHGPQWQVAYWRANGDEVDFVVSRGASSWALEVKSGRGGKASGFAAFRKRYPKAGAWLIGESGVPLAEFFSRPAEHWFA
jgi:predicted AAA+ superfamily ATPase